MNSKRLALAYSALMDRLFTELPEDVKVKHVTRSHYTKALRDTEEQFGIGQGDADYLEWVLTLIGRSPIIVEDERTDVK